VARGEVDRRWRAGKEEEPKKVSFEISVSYDSIFADGATLGSTKKALAKENR
jgi:hypothetical protein